MPSDDERLEAITEFRFPIRNRRMRTRSSATPPSADNLADRLTGAERLTNVATERPTTVEVPFAKNALAQILNTRIEGLSRVYRTLESFKVDLKEFFPTVPALLPASIYGQILQPNGMPATGVRVQVLAPTYGRVDRVQPIAWQVPTTITDARGSFKLDLPRAPRPEAGITLNLTGRNTTTKIAIRAIDLIGPGKLGVLVTDVPIAALEEDLFDKLRVRIPALAEDVEEHPEDFAEHPPIVTLGEGDCARSFQSNAGVVDRFRYGMLIRLVEPQLGQREVAYVKKSGNKTIKLSNPLLALGHDAFSADSILALLGAQGANGEFTFADRVPIDRPIDVTDFHYEVESDPEAVPKASTLGLGYIVKMRQTWIPQGLSLGDLVYSLPLAPGEEQRIAIFEQTESQMVRDFETAATDEAQRFGQHVDSSTDAVFSSAYREAAAGGSSFQSRASSSSVGGGAGIGGFFGVLFGVGVAGGHSSSSSSGSSSTWQRGSKDFVSSASEDFHQHISRQASARKRSSRTGVRLARASEREEVTTKILANRNHSHALTIQYWEVLRHYAVQSEVDDAQLVAYVPMELVSFLPSGQPRELPTGTAYTRDGLLRRYEMILRYSDVLSRRLRYRPQYRAGLRALRDFAADPTMTVQSSTASVQDVVRFEVTGTFLAFDDLTVTAVTRTGGRVGAFRLNGEPLTIDDSLRTKAQVIQHLDDVRNGTTGKTYSADITLPSHIARNDVVGFELRRRVRSFTYDSDLSEPDGITDFLQWLAVVQTLSEPISGRELEQEVGGPYIWDVSAKIQGSGETFVDAFQGEGARTLMGLRIPLSAQRLPPTLHFSDLLQIESLFQHVVRNTVLYSQVVWQSISATERAILLERFTIGMPEGGISDAGQEVPLLNCVANVVLGFYGNSMIMPFHIPPQVAEATKMTSRDVQEALLQFHREGFSPPRTSITLPTDGVLGEAVLGTCNSSEKIDLTRFWNWRDSPIEAASSPENVLSSEKLGGKSILTGVTAPKELASQLNTSLMTKILEGNVATAGALAKLIDKAPALAPFGDLTGKGELSTQIGKNIDAAKEGLKTAVEQGSSLASKAMEQAAGIAKEAEKTKLADKQAAEKKAAEKTAADAKKATETKEAAAKKHTDGVAYIKDNAKSVTAYIKATSDPNATAKQLVKELFGDDPKLTVAEKVSLNSALSATEVDATGAKALKTALGLPTGG